MESVTLRGNLWPDRLRGGATVLDCGHMHKLTVLALLAGGCTTTESSSVLTSGIYASITAETTGNGKTDVSASLFVGNPVGLNFVELTGDDSLVVVYGDQSKTMVETRVLNTVAHHAELATDAEGAQFEVVFDRAIDDGAPSSIATLPAKFDITTAITTASRASDLMVQWAPAGGADPMRWSAHGDCIEDESDTSTVDEGAFVIPANLLHKRTGDNVADTCAVTVTIRRSKAGLLDPHYGKGGTIAGVQARSITFTSTP